jgi:hypothetical protein
LQSPLFIVTPIHHISSKNLINLSKNLPICNSLWVTTHSHQVLAVSSINLSDSSLNLVLGWVVVDSESENVWVLIKTGFYGFRRACSRDYAMRLWHFVIVACHNRMAWNLGFLAWRLCHAIMTKCHSRMS